MKKIVLSAVSMCFCFVLIAQPPADRRQRQDLPIPPRPPMEGGMNRERREKIEMYKIQFISEKLNLTKEEAQSFWPVYNEHKKAMDEIFANKINDEIQLEEAVLNAKKKFKADLKPILKTEERVNEALKVNRDFLRNMRMEVMKRRGGEKRF